MSADGPFRVIETSTVTDEEIQRIVNETTAEGWKLEWMQFAMRESSRRPSMAFLFFVRNEA